MSQGTAIRAFPSSRYHAQTYLQILPLGDFACAVSRGFSPSGIASSAKRFPGHGDAYADSHLALPRILKSLDELRREELVPFRLIIAEDVHTTMTGQMALPKTTHPDIPRSLPRDITTNLPRSGLWSTEGVIVTDCLEMNAVAETYGVEDGAPMSLNAGVDVTMVCHAPAKPKGALEPVRAAMISGRMTLDSLRESYDRITLLKSKFAGSWPDVLSPVFDPGIKAQLRSGNATVSATAYLASTTQVSDLTGVFNAGSERGCYNPHSRGRPLVAPWSSIEQRMGKSETRPPLLTPPSLPPELKTCITSFKKGPAIAEEPGKHLSVARYIVFAIRNADRGA